MRRFRRDGPAALIGYYHYSNVRDVFDRPHLDREKAALDQGSKIHPQYREEFENSFSIEWHRIRHNEMSWVVWKNDGEYKEATAVLSEADGPFYFAGDWLSHLSGWQAGAFVTAHHAVKKIHVRIQA
jgi:monoamine oxidase